MSKQISAKKVKVKIPASIGAGNKVWLAGLGVLAVAQKQGSAAFDILVSEGKHVQTRGEKVARTLLGELDILVAARLKPVQQRLNVARRDAEASFERGFGRVLSYAGIPSKADVDALIIRVDRLSRQLRATK